jgi:NADP-dependent 3-hydroxy acid dehydrogenase YdfG
MRIEHRRKSRSDYRCERRPWESTARHLAGLGATVVLGARRKGRLDAIVKDITANGGKALAVTVDVTKREQVDALIQAALKAYGKVDVLVNNAGVMAIAPFAALKVDEWEKMIDINIKGVLYGIAAALPVFTKAKSGHFINLSSVAGIKVFAPSVQSIVVRNSPCTPSLKAYAWRPARTTSA